MNHSVFDSSSKLLTLSAVAVGYILLDDFKSDEQNALGNWLMLIAQMLCTNAYFTQLKDNENSHNISFDSYEDTINTLKKVVDSLNKEIEELKKNNI